MIADDAAPEEKLPPPSRADVVSHIYLMCRELGGLAGRYGWADLERRLSAAQSAAAEALREEAAAPSQCAENAAAGDAA